ncbi:helix-turn-helix domain-containing protein [Roseateles sp. SL47]|uniref:helix-turn-helix domain-containing protein n=1 Tax=Roseateles sp. SL47 TaxID=2995138 RepID=UPI00226DBAD0|nr:helix-turn-helix domain-containing protein [Roseateles sp. SL47]WAC74618.1 helix-turn-helix domain-containing protein [Roseateles sp. SL47]
MPSRCSPSISKSFDVISDWTEAISTHVGRISPALRRSEWIGCESLDAAPFSGFIETSSLGGSVLSRLMSSPNRLRRTPPSGTDDPSRPWMLCLQRQGISHFRQSGIGGTLHPGDWCVLDTRVSFEWWSPGKSEQLVLLPSLAADHDLHHKIEQGVGRRFDGRSGVARIVCTMVNEAINQVAWMDDQRRGVVAEALSALAWQAMEEQMQSPLPQVLRDAQSARVKAYIEERLPDADLSVESIARGCGLSMRSLQRIFADDPEGPVSAFIWRRRVERCAVSLRDSKNAGRSITDIAMSWGFANSSHFSRLFRETFGLTPRVFRAAH